jgi:hypothetical protein
VYSDNTHAYAYDEILTSDKARLELGSVMYAPNMLGSRGPRKMQVCIPVVAESGEIVRPKNAGVSLFKPYKYSLIVYMC